MARPVKRASSIIKVGDAVTLEEREGIASYGYMSLAEAAKFSGLSTTTLRNLIGKNRLIVSRPIPGRILVLRASLEAMLAAGMNLADAGSVDPRLFGEARQKALANALLQRWIAA